MAARENLTSAATKLLPSTLPGSNSASVSELDLRFFESSESLLLSFVLDPDSPYYLANLVCLEAVESINSLRDIASTLLGLLRADPIPLRAPEVDRHFELAGESLQLIGGRIQEGRAPEDRDVDAYVNESRLFATTQLVPQEVAISSEGYRARLQQAVDGINGLLPNLLIRLRNLDPANFFVDKLDESIPRSKQLSTYVGRIQKVRDDQEVLLRSEDTLSKSLKSSELLAETATAITLINTLKSLAFLRSRVRLPGTGYAVGSLDESLFGVASAATVLGEVVGRGVDRTVDVAGDPFLALRAPNNVLTLDVDVDEDGAVVNSAVTATLTNVASKPDTVTVFDSGGVGWVTEAGFAVTFSMSVVDSLGAPQTYTLTVFPIPTYATVTDLPVTAVAGDRAYVAGPAAVDRLYYVYAAGWGVGAVGAPTISPTEYQTIFNDSRRITKGFGGFNGPLLSALVDVLTPGSGLTFELEPSASWRDVGADISLRITTSGTDLQTPFGMGPIIAGGTTGAVVIGFLDEFKDISGDFSQVRVGHKLRIPTPQTNAGTYTITQVLSITAPAKVKLSTSLVVASGLTYEFVSIAKGNDLLNEGDSPTLTEVVTEINSLVGAYVTASSEAGQRLQIKSNTVGAEDGNGVVVSSYLQVTGQPLYAGAIALLGLDTAQKFGGSTAFYDPEGRFLESGLVPGMKLVFSVPVVDDFTVAYPTTRYGTTIVEVVSNNVLILAVPISVTTSLNTAYEIYASGALSYEQGVASAASNYADALQNLLVNTVQLEELLGRSVYTKGDRLRAESYIIQAIGDPTDIVDPGPAATLLEILSAYAAPVSNSIASSLASMRERGFDKSAALVLLGEIEDAIREENASYSRGLRQSLNALGIRNGVINFSDRG